MQIIMFSYTYTFVQGSPKSVKKKKTRPNYYTKELSKLFLEHIKSVEEFINIARVEGKPVPKKPSEWVKEAKPLKCQVEEEEEKDEKSSLKQEELGVQIYDCWTRCPVESVVPGWRGREDMIKQFCTKYEKVESFNKNETEYGDLASKIPETSLGDVKIPECEESEIPEEAESHEKQDMSRRPGKRPISESDELASSSEATQDPPQVEDLTTENNAYFNMIPHDDNESDLGRKIPFQERNESEITEEEEQQGAPRLQRRCQKMALYPEVEDFTEMEIPISVEGEMSNHLYLRFDISKDSSNNFGLDFKKDKYFFSTTKRELDKEVGGQEQSGTPETISNVAAFLPQPMVVDTSRCSSDEWRQAGVINLSEKNILSLDEEPKCPNLVLLFLQRNNGLTRIPSSFFSSMPALRFLDLSNTRISDQGLPDSLFGLKDLQVLMLRSCICLDSLPPEVEKLKNMQVLDLSSTDLYSLPNEIGQLTRLKHLQLSFYGPDYGSGYARLPQDLVSPSIFSEMKDLEALSIVVHPEDQRWIKIAGEIIDYITRLEKLSHLQFYFPTVDALNSFVKESLSWEKQRVKRFKFVVGHNVKRIISRVPGEVESKYEEFDQCLRFINGGEVPEIMKRVLKSVKAFYLDHHLEIQNLSEFGISNFDELKFCVVRECPNFQVMMVGQTSDDVVGAFPNLEHIGLHYLWELERVWEDPVPPGSFKALKYLMVDTCPKLEYIASQSMLRSLFNLETFIIEDCESLKSIVKESKSAKSDAILLPRLTALVLRHLPNLATLGSGLCPSDKIINRHFCPKLILSRGPRRSRQRKLLGRFIM